MGVGGNVLLHYTLKIDCEFQGHVLGSDRDDASPDILFQWLPLCPKASLWHLAQNGSASQLTHIQVSEIATNSLETP